MKEAVATLKRLCRQRTMLSWKEWREAVEKDRRQPTLQVQHAPLLQIPRFGISSRSAVQLLSRAL